MRSMQRAVSDAVLPTTISAMYYEGRSLPADDPDAPRDFAVLGSASQACCPHGPGRSAAGRIKVSNGSAVLVIAALVSFFQQISVSRTILL